MAGLEALTRARCSVAAVAADVSTAALLEAVAACCCRSACGFCGSEQLLQKPRSDSPQLAGNSSCRRQARQQQWQQVCYKGPAAVGQLCHTQHLPCRLALPWTSMHLHHYDLERARAGLLPGGVLSRAHQRVVQLQDLRPCSALGRHSYGKQACYQRLESASSGMHGPFCGVSLVRQHSSSTLQGTSSSSCSSSSSTDSDDKNNDTRGCQHYVLDFIHTLKPTSFPAASGAEGLQAGAAASPDAQGHCTDTAATVAQQSAAAKDDGGSRQCRDLSVAAAAAGTCAHHGARTQSAAPDPSNAPRGSVVAVALSGGVDSAVSALLLQQQGYQLYGVYMHNWDAADEAGAGTPTCTSAEDLADAKALCQYLRIPLYEADFVSRYWNDVFEAFLQGLSRGLTPNPDLACNSHIKFGALLQFARERGADLLATGHYARLGWAAAAATTAHTAAGSSAGQSSGMTAVPGWRPVLLTGSDAAKDQSYFLASLQHQQLDRALFPVGHLTKAQVRSIAAAAGLPQATKRSSAGICFIGRRSFGRFLEAYLQPQLGLYVDAVTGATLGPCSNLLAVTVGQKALGLGGQKQRMYVVGKDLRQGRVYVAAGQQHPALYSSRVLLQGASWVAGRPPAQLTAPVVASSVLPQPAAAGDAGCSRVSGQQGAAAAAAGGGVVAARSDSSGAGGAAAEVPLLRCQYQARYRQAAAQATVRLLSDDQARSFQASRFCQGLTGLYGSSSLHRGSGAAGADGATAVASQGYVTAAAEGCEGGVVAAAAAGGQYLLAELAVPLRGVAPGQMFVLYDGEVCLGSATIVAPGPTLFELQQLQQQQQQVAAGS